MCGILPTASAQYDLGSWCYTRHFICITGTPTKSSIIQLLWVVFTSDDGVVYCQLLRPKMTWGAGAIPGNSYVLLERPLNPQIGGSLCSFSLYWFILFTTVLLTSFFADWVSIVLSIFAPEFGSTPLHQVTRSLDLIAGSHLEANPPSLERTLRKALHSQLSTTKADSLLFMCNPISAILISKALTIL
eukprot:sb/3471271/